jgi:hypothetical protein
LRRATPQYSEEKIKYQRVARPVQVGLPVWQCVTSILTQKCLLIAGLLAQHGQQKGR